MRSTSQIELTRGDFRTTRSADELNARFQSLLRLPHRYGPARLAIGRSLGLPSQPELQLNSLGYGKPLKGEQLFGQGVELACWLTLIIEHVSGDDISRKDFQTLVAAHWHRGIYLLWEDWKTSAGELDQFIERIARHAHGRAK